MHNTTTESRVCTRQPHPRKQYAESISWRLSLNCSGSMLQELDHCPRAIACFGESMYAMLHRSISPHRRVVPAKAGIQFVGFPGSAFPCGQIPAFVGMTNPEYFSVTLRSRLDKRTNRTRFEVCFTRFYRLFTRRRTSLCRSITLDFDRKISGQVLRGNLQFPKNQTLRRLRKT